MTNQPKVISGISFNLEQLKKISVLKLIPNQMAKGHLFYITKTDKAFLIHKAGHFISEEKLKNWKDQGHEYFFIQEMLDESKISEVKLLLQDFKQESDQHKLSITANQLANEITRLLIVPYPKTSINLVFLMRSEFLQIEDELQLELYDRCYELWIRSEIQAAFAVYFALALGYHDWQLLSDIYHCAYFLDLAINQSSLDFNLFEQLVKSSKSYTNKSVEEFFKAHTLSSEQIVNEKLIDVFYNPHLTRLIARHHEKKDSHAGLIGLNNSSLTDLEKIIANVSELVPKSFDHFTPTDMQDFIKQIEKFEFKFLTQMILSIFEEIKNNYEQKVAS
jgi:hypothetical protein